MTTAKDLVLTSTEGGVTTVTMNRPEALNALSAGLRNRLTEVFTDLAEDSATEVIVFTGNGRAFTVGLDLKELGGETAAATVVNKDLGKAMLQVNKPIIGAINGYAITGGFELALMCDFMLASEQAKFADTHARVGVVPGWGLSQRLPRLIGINRAKELSLTGNFLDAATAYTWGLVNRVVAADELLATAQQLAKDIVSTEPVTRNAVRHIMDAGWHTSLTEGLVIERDANREHAKTEVRAEKVAARRAQIQQRGRSQSDD
ncbi:MAG TPA: enoyl-CoA hydratase [Gammaproteobacteria bacterium]|nr:enoyl-CoA hydratase [Gammaproteobacteria bacterium]HBF64358.1 enoyl-CoA hydratase [Gammaproteobacteria bacterium]HBK13805.1 enoyl-CoA hydratase [Gammaproteobacteria bacterium]|tara:strand:+ start:3887 stop:4669 length:783 start_codon:yes stop_codon:yes gene_type:complete